MFGKARHDKDEHGVIVVLFAISALLIFMVGAVAVDLGNAFARHRDSQTEADFAALAGGDCTGCLPAPHSTPLASDPAVAAVATYLLKNWPADDSGNPKPTLTQLETQLTTLTGSGQNADGQVYYGSFDSEGNFVPNINQLTVITPQSQVNFGLANALGVSHTDVDATATVEVRSPGVDTLPFYAASGCDYGEQTIAQTNNGHSADTVMLAYPSDTNSASLLGLSPTQIAQDDTTTALTINGSKLTGTTQVGFFESGNGVTGPLPVTVPSTGFTVNASGTQIVVKAPLPTGLTSVQDVWYVRVMIGGKWSAVSQGSTLLALQLTVGQPILTCAQGSSSGNFGTLPLTNLHGGGADEQIAENIIGPMDHSLAAYPSPHSDWTCTSGAPSVLWPGDGTNCVSTQTGLPQDAATWGFVSGVNGLAGRLTDVSANTGCATDGDPQTTGILGQYTINDDTLSCFLTDTTGSVNVGDIDSPTYSLDEPALAQQIYASPRFFYVPVVGVVPTSGGSHNYQIVDFRPAFLTDQINSATWGTPATSTNGLRPTSTNKALQSVQVVFLNPNALPPPPPGRTTPYQGHGPKVIQLVD